MDCLPAALAHVAGEEGGSVVERAKGNSSPTGMRPVLQDLRGSHSFGGAECLSGHYMMHYSSALLPFILHQMSGEVGEVRCAMCGKRI